MNMTLEATEAECAKGRTAPRVSLDDIKNAICARYDVRGNEVAFISDNALAADIGWNELPKCLDTLSLCILVMRNGFMVVGKSAPAAPENFDAELGRKLAYEDCIRQLWPLMGYSLRDKLHAAGR
jgi:hypothetical protein